MGLADDKKDEGSGRHRPAAAGAPPRRGNGKLRGVPSDAWRGCYTVFPLSAPTAPRARGRASASSPASSPDARPPRREILIAYLHLGVLSAFACAQALFDLLGRTPEFFATRGSGAGEIVLLGLTLVLVPPALLVGVELLGGLIDRRVRRGIHLFLVGALVASLALQALKGLAGGGLALVALALAFGAAAAVAYARLAWVRSFLTVLAPAPAVFLVLFLLLSPVSRLTLGGQSEARADPVAARAPVVMVVFDELPLVSLLDARGRIDRRRVPSFAALAGDATWFPNATTLSDQTTKAVPAILTGRRPREGGSRSSVSGPLPIAADYPNSLFTMLGDRYRHNVSEEVTTLCPEDLCEDAGRGEPLARAGSLASDLGLIYLHLALPEALAEQLPPVSDAWGNFGDGGSGGRSHARKAHARVQSALEGARAERFDEFIAGVEGGPEPSLDFKHSLLPHVPWEYLPSGRRYRAGATEPVPGLVPASGTEPFRDDFRAEQAYQRHLLQVGYADRLLGRLLARLRERGVYDRAAIVVVADHGVSLRRGVDRRGPVERSVEDIASVPLLIKAPGQRGGRADDAYVRTHEVLPTLADVLGVRLPWRADGRSGFSAEVRRRSSVELLRRSGRPIVLAAREFERRRAAAVARQGTLFGSGGSRLYGIGPNPELIGRAVSDLPVGRGDGAQAQFKGGSRLRAHDPRSGFSPSHVVGKVRGSPPAGGRESRELAVAVNGRISAVAESYRSRGDEFFSALVPESALRPGDNTVELLEVTRAGGGELRLTSLGRA